MCTLPIREVLPRQEHYQEQGEGATVATPAREPTDVVIGVYGADQGAAEERRHDEHHGDHDHAESLKSATIPTIAIS